MSAERDEAERLYRLLDDIDTLDDACKHDSLAPDLQRQRARADAAFRSRAMDLARRRWDGPIDTDGYQLSWDGEPKPDGWVDPPEPSTPQEG